MTRKDAFAEFGAKLKNPVWSWSARAEDRVVLSLWASRFQWGGKPVSYDGSHGPGDEAALGNRARLKDLIWARDHCDGRIAVVMQTGTRGEGGVWKIDDCFPRPDLAMRLTMLDERTGAFRAEVVGTA